MKAVSCNPSLLVTRYALEMQIMLQRWVTGPLFWLVDRGDLHQRWLWVKSIRSPLALTASSILEALPLRPGKSGPWWVWLDKAGTGILCCRTQLLDTNTVSVRLSLSNSFLLFGLLVLSVCFFSFPLPLSNRHSYCWLQFVEAALSHGERVCQNLNLHMSKSLLGFSAKPLFSCIDSEESLSSAQWTIQRSGCLQHVWGVLTHP